MGTVIGIVGNGFVGSAIVSGFMLCVDDILIYDKNPAKSTHSLSEVVNGSDFVFVSVPTPMRDVMGGPIDLSIMDSVIRDISIVNERRDNIIVIKSTVVPGTVEKYVKQYPNLNIIFSPEFLTERASRLDFINTSRIILGGQPELTGAALKLFRRRFPHTQIIETDLGTAQFIKYMANCFFSVKLSFMNEMLQGAEALNLDWDTVVKGFITDGRIGNSHIDVPGHDGSRGWGGKCFSKDLNAFINLFIDLGIDPNVMMASWKKNLEVRDNYDWEEIEGAVSKSN